MSSKCSHCAFTCRHCACNFTTKFSLKRHLRRQHNLWEDNPLSKKMALTPGKTASTPGKLAPTPERTTKIGTGTHSGKLWIRESCMFDEKFFYLDKSNTKYVTTGLEAKFLQPVAKICDRVTGCHILLNKLDIVAFTQVISSILDGTYKLVSGFIEGAMQVCGITFYCMTSDIWKLTQVDQHVGVVLLHRNSLNVFMGLKRLILNRIMTADIGGYSAFITKLNRNTIDLDDSVVLSYLYEQLAKTNPACLEYQALSDIICNEQLYVTENFGVTGRLIH